MQHVEHALTIIVSRCVHTDTKLHTLAIREGTPEELRGEHARLTSDHRAAVSAIHRLLAVTTTLKLPGNYRKVSLGWAVRLQ